MGLAANYANSDDSDTYNSDTDSYADSNPDTYADDTHTDSNTDTYADDPDADADSDADADANPYNALWRYNGCGGGTIEQQGENCFDGRVLAWW